MVDGTGFYTKYLYEGLDYTHIGFNTRNAPLHDKKVRQALAYGLDREAFLQARYGEYGFTLDVPFAKASWAFDSTIPQVTYDPAKAEALLDEAGWKKGADGFRAKVKYQSGSTINYSQVLIKDSAFRIGDTKFVLQGSGTAQVSTAVTDPLTGSVSLQQAYAKLS